MSRTAVPTAETDDGPAPSPTRRLPALDVLRGLAILGTFLTNIWIFSGSDAQLSGSRGREFLGRVRDGMPVEEARRLAESTTEASTSFLAELSTHLTTGLGLVTDGKFIGLLTIMFGIGLEIQRQSAIRRGESWPGRYPWRAGLLILDGLLNYIFIFEYDVLMGYGLTGLVVAAVMATSPKAQKIWMIVGVTVHLVLMILPTFVPHISLLSFISTDQNDDLPPTPGEIDLPARALAETDTTYWAGVVGRVTDFWTGRDEIPIMFTMGLGLFLVGAHLYRAGLFQERGRRLRLWVMALSFGIGLPIDWTLRLFFSEESASVTRYVTSSLVAFGVLALVAHFYVRRSTTGPVGTALSYVGRMALTCYILQNLIASIVFLPWGFGVAELISGEGSTLWTLLIYVVIAAALVGMSALWLSRFSRGPVELVWHWSYESIVRVLDRRKASRAAATASRGEGPSQDDPAPSSRSRAQR